MSCAVWAVHESLKVDEPLNQVRRNTVACGEPRRVIESATSRWPDYSIRSCHVDVRSRSRSAALLTRRDGAVRAPACSRARGRRSVSSIIHLVGDPCDQLPPSLLATGIDQFNRGEYFAQHETLEELWRAEAGDVRYLYQGILQIGVAMYHIQRDNHHGVTYMLTRGLQHLRRCSDTCQGVDVAALIASAEHLQEVVAALGPDGLREFDWTLAPRVVLRSS